jgi:hypothetical protein
VSAEGGTRAVIAALLANAFIAVTKFAAWALTGASSMLAEAIHSVADSGNQVLLLVGGRRSKKGATAEHPFGYGRERYVFGLLSPWSVQKRRRPVRVVRGVPSGTRWPMGIRRAAGEPLVGSNRHLGGRDYRRELFLPNGHRSPTRPAVNSVEQFIRAAKAPELPVILLEDFAALVGLMFALFGSRHDVADSQRHST